MSDTVVRYWRLSLAAGLAVLAVVALLLETLVRTEKQILHGTARIWEVGKLIANNTVHVPLLGRVNHNLGEISACADEIAQAADRIQKAAGASARSGG